MINTIVFDLSEVILTGFLGVGKEIARGFVNGGVEKLVIINRTADRAKEMADAANALRLGVAEYGGEDKIEHYLTDPSVDVAINVSKKGAEPLEKYSAFAIADTRSEGGVAQNYVEALEVSRKIAEANPQMVIYDINLPASGVPRTLEIAREAGLVNLVDGKGMVTNQGIIAIENVQRLSGGILGEKFNRDYARGIFEEALK